jgi:DNA polymerase
MSRRAEVLAEMGISPVWRLRAKEISAEVPARGWIPLKAAVSGCVKCGLHKTRTQTVFGVGDENADWMLIGEAPGAEEDRLGDPFVGQAGSCSTTCWRRSAFRAAPTSTSPTCSSAVRRATAIPSAGGSGAVQPASAAADRADPAEADRRDGTLRRADATRDRASISSLRGRVHRYAGVPLIVTYHPAYLLRTLEDKAKTWEDLLFAGRYVRCRGPIARNNAAPPAAGRLVARPALVLVELHFLSAGSSIASRAPTS